MSELGTKLREARVAKGLTLNSLQQTTKIQKKYLEAIEEGRFEDIPGTFYARGFVKQYADVVGLNGDELLLEHQEELEAAHYGSELEVPESESELPSRLTRVKEQQGNALLDRVTPYVPFILLATVIIALMVGIIFAIQKANNKDRELASSISESLSLVASVSPESAQKPAESVKKEDEMKIGPSDIEMGPNAKLTLVSSEAEETMYRLYGSVDRYDMEIKGEGLVWVGIFEDDQIVVDTVINEGEKVAYKMPDSVKETRIRIGYPEGAKIYVNNKVVPINSLYFADSILFLQPVKKDTDNETATEEENVEEVAEPEEEQGFQGPAALDPANTSSEE